MASERDEAFEDEPEVVQEIMFEDAADDLENSALAAELHTVLEAFERRVATLALDVAELEADLEDDEDDDRAADLEEEWEEHLDALKKALSSWLTETRAMVEGWQFMEGLLERIGGDDGKYTKPAQKA